MAQRTDEQQRRIANATKPLPASLQRKLNDAEQCLCNNEPYPCDACARVFAEASAIRLGHSQP